MENTLTVNQLKEKITKEALTNNLNVKFYPDNIKAYQCRFNKESSLILENIITPEELERQSFEYFKRNNVVMPSHFITKGYYQVHFRELNSCCGAVLIYGFNFAHVNKEANFTISKVLELIKYSGYTSVICTHYDKEYDRIFKELGFEISSSFINARTLNRVNYYTICLLDQEELEFKRKRMLEANEELEDYEEEYEEIEVEGGYEE